MMIAMIENASRICGKQQGYLGLPVRDIIITDKATGKETPAMETAWTPTPEELAKLNAGANVILRILGSVPPPQLVMVGDVPPPTIAYAFTPESCPGHVASSDAQVCARCGIHINDLLSDDPNNLK